MTPALTAETTMLTAPAPAGTAELRQLLADIEPYLALCATQGAPCWNAVKARALHERVCRVVGQSIRRRGVVGRVDSAVVAEIFAVVEAARSISDTDRDAIRRALKC